MVREIFSESQDSWIAWISPFPGTRKKHTVIVDKVIGDDVYIRDPWPLEAVDGISFKNSTYGVEGVVDISEFAQQWAYGFNFMFKVK